MLNTNDSTIIICGIIRDAEKGLKRNIPVINELCTYFKDFKIIIYENDSKDKTKFILNTWKNTNPEKIHIILENTYNKKTIPKRNETNFNPFFCRKRIEKMVILRNKYMEYIERHKWNADFLIVVDLDVASLNLKGILSSFQLTENWDVITAFGYSISPKLKLRYHDSYALVELGKDKQPQTEESINSLSEKYGKLINSTNLIQVYSAFGGLAIYKFSKIKDLKYKIIYNNDSKVEVRCEHFSIYAQMNEKQDDCKVYINPQMKLKYQNITISLIIKTIKRILFRIPFLL